MTHQPLGFAATHARALRVVALAIAAMVLGRHLAGAYAPGVEGRVLAIRLGVAAIALLLGLCATPQRSEAVLRVLALLLGLDATFSGLVVALVNPIVLWEQAALIVAVIFGAALFMPWPWHWQAGFAALNVGTAAILVFLLAPSAPSGPEAVRLFFTLVLLAFASVAGSYLADLERRRVASSEARYRALFAGAGDAIAVLDHTGTIREANPQLLELLGWPPDRVLGARLRDFYAADQAVSSTGGGTEGVMNEHLAALAGTLRSATRTVLDAEGRPVEVEVTFARAETADGPIVQAILRNMAERRARERRQVQEQRLDSLARLAGGMAHQFNNLLGGILTHASVLRQEAAPEAAAGLDAIAEAARRGRSLTQELLRFARQVPLVRRPTAPAVVVDNAATLAHAALPEKVRIEAQVAPDLPYLAGDPDHLAHACLQLVLNARDAMLGRPEGRLTIAAAEQTVAPGDRQWPGAAPGRYIRISVSDTGVGMDAATLDRVYEPFFTTKPMHQAKGLGLAAVYAVVREHGGAVRIESAPGKGTTVHLLIPVSTEPAPSLPSSAPPPTPPPPAPVAAKQGGTVLVVDDEAIIRSSLRRALGRLGYRVLEAGDGPSAVAALRSAEPPVDLVILDLVLPGGGAAVFELVKAIRPDVKVLISSGYSPEEQMAKALASRADGFLPKPYEIGELRAAVARALQPT